MVRFLAIWLIFLIPAAHAAEEAALLLSAELKPYLEFAEGFQSLVGETKVFVLPREGPLAKHFFLKNPSWAIAVGTRALRFLQKIPVENIFYALVVSPESAKKLLPDRNICGLYLRLPPEITFPLLREFLNEQLGLQREKPIFLIPYSSDENISFIKEAQNLGDKLQVEVRTVLVNRVSLLRTLLQQEDFDLLYCIPDPLFATEEAISLVLRLALLRGKAVCGYNRFFLEKGALVSFVFDYREIGKETARRWKTGSCGPAPSPFKFVVNKKVFKFLHQKILEQKNKNLEKPKRGAAKK